MGPLELNRYPLQMHSILRRLFGYAKHKARTVASSGLVRVAWLRTYLRAGGTSVQLPCATSAAMPMDSPRVGCGWMVLPMSTASAPISIASEINIGDVCFAHDLLQVCFEETVGLALDNGRRIAQRGSNGTVGFHAFGVGLEKGGIRRVDVLHTNHQPPIALDTVTKRCCTPSKRSFLLTYECVRARLALDLSNLLLSIGGGVGGIEAGSSTGLLRGFYIDPPSGLVWPSAGAASIGTRSVV